MHHITERLFVERNKVNFSAYKVGSHAFQTMKPAIKAMFLFGLIILPAVFLGLQAVAAESGQENLFAKNYKAQNANNLKSFNPNVDTQMFVSNHKDEDNTRMLEDGYDLMGTTGFDAGDVSPTLALDHGKAIKADVVLIYTKYGSAKTADSKMQMIREAVKTKGEVTEADLVEEEVKYKYFASYWAKVPKPLMGVHVIKLVQSTDNGPKPEPGLKIIAVIKGSAAANANMVKGDVLLSLGDAQMNQPDDLFAAVKRYAGKTVPAVYARAGEEVATQLTLGSR